jgi:hypothetical protein
VRNDEVGRKSGGRRRYNESERRMASPMEGEESYYIQRILKRLSHEIEMGCK